MKINYQNEDYNSVLFNIVVYVFLMLFIIIWGICNSSKSIDVGLIVFCSIWIIFLGILFVFSLKSHKQRREKRNLNLFIMKNGECIQGKVVLVYENSHPNRRCSTAHNSNIVAQINYRINNEDKVVIVDHLSMSLKKAKKYENKIVNIYIYNNMSYIDIMN